MHLGRLVTLWIARHLLALVLILFVLIAGRYLLVPGVNWIQSEARQAREIDARQEATARAYAQLQAYARGRREQAQAAMAALPEATSDRLRQRLDAIPAEVADHRKALLSGPAMAMAGIAGQSDRIFGHYRASAEIALLAREREMIEALLQVREGQDRQLQLGERRRQAVARFNASRVRWQAAQAQVEQLERRPLAEARNVLCRTVRPAVGCNNYRALRAAREARDSAWTENRAALRAVQNIDRARSAMAAANSVTADASSLVAAQVDALQREHRRLESAAGDNWLAWVRRPIVEMLPTALMILAIAIFGPALLKAFLYFIVAPAASRRPPVRLQPGDQGDVDDRAFHSAVSQRIALRDDEELLVVPEAIQSSPHAGAKSTKWFLNADIPFSSLASGLVALVRFRGAEGSVQVTATGDPLAEIGLLALPIGSAMVVRPRALRGVVHPVGRPVAVRRHWRLGLSAWLGLQLRYLVFHGPCTLIVQGSRGVRLERAGGGRGINRAATIAFSAGLDFSVRRSEAFAPYLMGRQDLLNHSFSGGPGFLVYEEMPRSGQRGGLWGRGLVGLGDAVLKTIGL
ncbi:MAG TPA: hypothetical protein VFO69_06195 [Allosphingosinicella sp.]|nr:hypothetical protein [Allosphingosinicella sp.]